MKKYNTITIRDEVTCDIVAHIVIEDEGITCLTSDGYSNIILDIEEDSTHVDKIRN